MFIFLYNVPILLVDLFLGSLACIPTAWQAGLTLHFPQSAFGSNVGN